MRDPPRLLVRWPPEEQDREPADGQLDSLSSVVGYHCIADSEPTLNSARRPPERPLLVPAEDAGPSPAFGFTTPHSDIRSQLVPTAMLKGDTPHALKGRRLLASTLSPSELRGYGAYTSDPWVVPSHQLLGLDPDTFS